MIKYALIVLFVFAVVCGAFVAGYFLGRAHRQIEYVEKQVEGIKYVEKKHAVIAARPNSDRTELLKLMQAGKL